MAKMVLTEIELAHRWAISPVWMVLSCSATRPDLFDEQAYKNKINALGDPLNLQLTPVTGRW